MVIGQLLPVRAVEAGQKVFLQLSGKTTLQKEVDCQISEIKGKVFSAVQKSRQFGCKFALSCDSWKTKCVPQQHYVSVLLDWVDQLRQRQSACAYCSEISALRAALKYAEQITQAMQVLQLQKSDILAMVTDHESALRRACQDMDINGIGCSCVTIKARAASYSAQGSAEI